jgi:hypothetical protein
MPIHQIDGRQVIYRKPVSFTSQYELQRFHKLYHHPVPPAWG